MASKTDGSFVRYTSYLRSAAFVREKSIVQRMKSSLECRKKEGDGVNLRARIGHLSPCAKILMFTRDAMQWKMGLTNISETQTFQRDNSTTHLAFLKLV